MTDSLYITWKEFDQVKNTIAYYLMHNGFLVDRWKDDDHRPIEILEFYTKSKSAHHRVLLSYLPQHMVGLCIINVTTVQTPINISVPFKEYETTINAELAKALHTLD